MDKIISYEGLNPFDENDIMAKVTTDSGCKIALFTVPSTEQFSISYWIKGSGKANVELDGQVILETQVSDEWKKVTKTFDATKNDEVVFSLASGEYYIYQAQIERGNIATDYEEAPEDVETTYKTLLSITAEGIMTEVSQKIGAQDEKISQIGQTADLIYLVVKQGSTEAKIELTPEVVSAIANTVYLQGEHIILDGDTTVGSGFTLTADKIKGGTITGLSINLGNGQFSVNSNGKMVAKDIELYGDNNKKKVSIGDALTLNYVDSSSEEYGSYVKIEYDKIVFYDANSNVISEISITEGSPFAESMGFNNVTIGDCYNYMDKGYFYIGVGAEKGVRVPIITTTSSANARINDYGTLLQSSSSSKRYKHNISDKLMEELNPQKLYELPIKQYIYNSDYLSNKEDSRYNKEVIGFIAEDVADIYPIACEYNDETKQIENWNERYIIPPMLKLIQEQHSELEKIKSEINKLKETIKSMAE